MPGDFDFDPSNSSLNIGIEVEYPVVSSGTKYLVHRGGSSSSLHRRCEGLPSSIGGRHVYDGTIGAEFVSNVLDLEDAPMWYRDVIDHVEEQYGDKYQPCGLLSTGSTAGTHIHLSSISEDKARDLYRLSEEPWAHIFFCSSVCKDPNDDSIAWPVHRGGSYCRMSYGTDHYDVVNVRNRRDGHYEWRLPEPMLPEHVDVFVQFLRIFEQDTNAAIQFAQELLDDGDERITAIRRAEEIGMAFDEMPLVERNQSSEDPEGFYETIESEWYYPEIHRVEVSGDDFYVLESEIDDVISTPFGDYDPDAVVWADSLEEVNDIAVQDEVRSAYNRAASGTGRETEATQELKKIVKKKKS